MTLKINFPNIDLFIFDFDGVLTPNTVYVDEDGKEFVRCSRSDGLAFDVLNKLNKKAYIISSEKNAVVNARAKKINIPVLQGINNKLEAVENITEKHNTSLFQQPNFYSFIISSGSEITLFYFSSLP